MKRRVDALRLALEIECEPDALVGFTCVDLERLANVAVDGALLGPIEYGRYRRVTLEIEGFGELAIPRDR